MKRTLLTAVAAVAATTAGSEARAETLPSEAPLTCTVNHFRTRQESTATVTLKTSPVGAERRGTIEIRSASGTVRKDVVLRNPKPMSFDRTYWEYAEGTDKCELLVAKNGDTVFNNCDASIRTCKAGSSTPPTPVTKQTCLDDVEATFASLPGRVDDKSYLRAREAGQIPASNYTGKLTNNFGLKNHFQGVQRIGQYLFVSGSNEKNRLGHLVVVRMGSRPERGSWSLPKGNLVTSFLHGNPKLRVVSVPDEDRIEAVHVVGTGDRNHPGGFQALGNIIPLPLSGEGSEIKFYDVSNPKNLVRKKVTIERTSGASATAIARIPDGRIVLAVEGGSASTPYLDFYISKTPELMDGFNAQLPRWTPGRVNFDGFEGLNFVPQCDGKLYLVGTHNTSGQAPTIPGADWADLYRVDFEPTYARTPVLTKVANKHLYCYDDQCNFDAGGGVYVEPGNHLAIYGVYHWLKDDQVRFNEYWR
jgi:hypothetical protein